MDVRFGGMAHIVRPKDRVQYHVGFETALAKKYDINNEVGVWQQHFPFDGKGNKDEVVMLWGKDLEDAKAEGKTGSFQDAYNFAMGILKNGFDSVDPKVVGGDLLLGRTRTNSRAALYKHNPND